MKCAVTVRKMRADILADAIAIEAHLAINL